MRPCACSPGHGWRCAFFLLDGALTGAFAVAGRIFFDCHVKVTIVVKLERKRGITGYRTREDIVVDGLLGAILTHYHMGAVRVVPIALAASGDLWDFVSLWHRLGALGGSGIGLGGIGAIVEVIHLGVEIIAVGILVAGVHVVIDGVLSVVSRSPLGTERMLCLGSNGLIARIGSVT